MSCRNAFAKSAIRSLVSMRERLLPRPSKTIWFFKLQTCHMRAFQLAKIPAQTVSFAAGGETATYQTGRSPRARPKTESFQFRGGDKTKREPISPVYRRPSQT